MRLLTFSLLLLAGLCAPLSAQINWQHTNGPEGASTYDIYCNDQYAFLPDLYNLYRSADGITWEKLPQRNLWPVAVSNSTIAAQQGRGFNYAPEPTRFIVSHDNGDTWTEGTFPPTLYGGFSRIAVCSHGIYVPDGAQSKMFRSQDDGLTWDTIPPPGSYSYDVWTFEDKLYAEWYSKIWRLAPNATDWELVSPEFGPQEYPHGMYVSGQLRLFSTSQNIWASSDDGITWTKTPIPYLSSSNNKFVPFGGRIYKDGGNTGLVYTEDLGLTWHEFPLSTEYDQTDIGAIGGRLLFPTYNKGVFYLDVANEQLLPADEGLTSAAVYGLEASQTELWAACGNGVFAYSLADSQWVDKAPLPFPRADHYVQTTISQSGKVAATDWLSDHFYLSHNAGASWDTLYPFGGWGSFGHVRKLNWLDDVLLINDDFSGMRSADFGQTWEPVPVAPEQTVPFNGKYFGLNYGQLYSSSDVGLTWQPEQGPALAGILALFSTGDRLFLHGEQDFYSTALYTSTDGVNWQYATDGLPDAYYSPGSDYDVYRGNVWNKSGKYFLYQPDIGFFVSTDTCKTWLPLQRNLHEHLVLKDTAFYAGGFGGGVIKTGLPQNYGAITNGLVFKDDNNNGQQDAGETALPNVQVNIKEPLAWYPFWFVTTKQDGRFVIGSTPGGGDTLRARVHSNYVANINPPFHILNGNTSDRNFGIHFTQDVTDLAVSGHYPGRPRPGFDLNTGIYYTNDGTLPANGTVSVKLDPNLQFIDADPVPSAVFGGDSLVWNIAQLPLFGHEYIRIGGHIDQGVALGTLLKIRGHITPDQPDFTPGNNHFTLCDTVVGSYDPNEKRVEPAAGLTAGDIAAGKELLYTIQFQNTGTFEAERVRITDHLDTALNAATLRLVAASHPVTSFRLLPGGLLEIVFDHIALPDSNASEAASHGFVTFAIQRHKSYAPGFKILNKAAIYFDFNEPVITNTVTTKLSLVQVATSEPENGVDAEKKLNLSPNPTRRNFTVDTEGKLSGPGHIDLVNIHGQICFQQQVADLSLPLDVKTVALSDGLYLVRATGKQGVLSGKLVIQH